MSHGVVVRGGDSYASASSSSLHVRSDGEEGGGEVVECHVEGDALVVNGDGNERHPSPVFSEGRNEGGVFLGFILDHNVAVEVPPEADLYKDEGAMFRVKQGRVREGSVRDSSCIDEV